MKLAFELDAKNSQSLLNIEVETFVVAGWAGRDIGAIEHHIKELEDIGVPRPSAVPLYYRVSAQQLTQSSVIECVGENSSGEIEPFAFVYEGELYISVDSDHTDRTLETHSVALSKQICAKPTGKTAWKYSEIKDHWDDIILRSWIETDEGDVLYQDGLAGSLRSPDELVKTYLGNDVPLPEGLGMSCGTVGVIGGIRPGSKFRMELIDEKLNRKIVHRYETAVLPEIA